MKMIYRVFLLCLVVVLAACDSSSQKQAEQNSDKLEQISQQINVLTAEVIRLQEQVARSQAPSEDAPSMGNKSLELDVSSYLSRIGNKDAEFVIVEFMDYQCPYCLRHAKQVLPELKRKYIDSGLVQYVVHDFPLDFHAQAENAAVAARCAAHQGRFKDMHSTLVDNSSSLSPEFYLELGRQLNLDEKKFSSCLKDDAQYQAVRDGVKSALRMGVSGTPRFLLGQIEGKRLVNIQVLSGAQPMHAFLDALERVFSLDQAKTKG